MPELSVIVPFVNEYPQVIFTLQSIAQELRDRVDFEIIAVDNSCAEITAQGRELDGSAGAVSGSTGVNPWLKYLKYEDKLSHWQAKNLAARNSSSPFLWFCDAHCIVGRDALFNMFTYYRKHHQELHGTLHLPLTYKILDSRRLIYKLLDNYEAGEIHYKFTPLKRDDGPFQVPCMSTCGMMMTREIYDEIGGWPDELGIYGGGENFINFTLAVLGYTVNIFPGPALFHHGEKRGYHWNFDDYTRNRTIATYMFGGEALARKFIQHRKGDTQALNRILDDVLTRCRSHREHIKARQKLTIEQWLAIQKREVS